MPTTAFQWRWITVASLLSFVVGIGFFCPRYVLWRGLDIPQARYNPEVHRAYYRLQQIEHPFDPIENENNRAMRWRLLFPLLAHYLHLPRNVLFALPFIGCLLALGLTAYVVLRETGSTLLALLSSMLAATTSWFFVSTGWLSYFDSWYILGLLCVSFIRNKTTLVVCCLCVAWIDERFILGLPLAFTVRTAVFRWVEDGKVAQLFRETGLACFVVAPYLLFRLALLFFAQDANSAGHLTDHYDMLFLHNKAYLSGLWHGLRAGWVPVLACVLLAYGNRGIKFKIAGAIIVVFTLFINRFLAADFSRSVSVLMPCVLLGSILIARYRPSLAFGVTAFALLVNLLTPARHINSAFSVDIHNALYEREQANDPPNSVNPVFYNQHGIKLFKENDVDGAESFFTGALHLAQDNPPPNNAPALIADIYWNRANLYANSSMWLKALPDLEDALENAPADWNRRDVVKSFAAEISQRYQPPQE